GTMGMVPAVPYGVALAALGTCAAFLVRPHGRLRRASQAARLAVFCGSLVLPAVAMYPSLEAFATSARETWIASRFGPHALSLRDDLQRQLDRTLEAIDGMPGLSALIDGRSEDSGLTTDEAFTIWANTALAEARVTSSVELFAATGELVSRFALNLPEYG